MKLVCAEIIRRWYVYQKHIIIETGVLLVLRAIGNCKMCLICCGIYIDIVCTHTFLIPSYQFVSGVKKDETKGWHCLFILVTHLGSGVTRDETKGWPYHIFKLPLGIRCKKRRDKGMSLSLYPSHTSGSGVKKTRPRNYLTSIFLVTLWDVVWKEMRPGDDQFSKP